jgi:hypothetical protein
MKLMVRIGAIVGLALTLLIASCGERTGTDEQSVYDRQTEQSQSAEDRAEPEQERGRASKDAQKK